jgi:type I restriction enzyme R subunit
MKPYREYVENFNSGVKTLHTIVKTVDEVDQLEGEDLKNFVKTFRDLLRLLNRITTFTEFSYKDLSLPEQEIEDYKSKYIDIYDPPTSIGEKESVLEDIDFEIELLRRDDINVEYILKLLKKLRPNTPGFEKDKQFILNTMEKDIKLRSKIDLINKFIEENIVKPNENVNTEEKLEEYMDREKKTAINQLITSENLHQDKTKNLINEYEFSGKIKPMEVANLFTEKLKLKDKRRKRQELKQEIMDLIDKYTW